VQTTDGNLRTHLAKLEEDGYVKIRKSFKKKRPQTSCAMTKKGKEAFKRYLDILETVINMQKDF
jgi:predicted ArsR family transcriptional regulator